MTRTSARTLLQRYGDVLLGVGLALAYLVELATWPGSGDRVAVVGVAGVGASLALVLRRQSPLASFILCQSLLVVVEFAWLSFSHNAYVGIAVFLINLYSLGAHAHGTEAWLGIVGLGVAIAYLAHGDGDYSAGGIAFYCALCGLPWGAGLAIRLRIERVTELEAHHARLREEAAHAVADERARIARELHDVVSHAIAVTVLQARGGRRMVGREEDAVRRALDAIEQTNTAALGDMRRLLELLRDSGAEGSADHLGGPTPSLERLDHLLVQVRDSGLPVELTVVGDQLPLPPGLDLSAFRIVQEALTNVLKHAGPHASARVEIGYGPDELVVEVTNTGRVSTTTTPQGHGLIGIRERVAVAGGSVEAGARPGGFAVRARLPYLTELVGRPDTVRVP